MNKTSVCPQCGKEFRNVNNDRVYCSFKCNTRANTESRRKYDVKKCAQCGVEFDPDDYRRKYCSEECLEKGRIRLRRVRYQRKKIEESKKYKICAYKACGKKFIPNLSNQKFCSRQCGIDFHAEKRAQSRFDNTIGYKNIKEACPNISSQGLEVRIPDFNLGF